MLELADPALDAIRRHGERDYPNEACGLLLGSGDSAAEALPLPNVAGRPRHFEVRPGDYVAAERRARERGLDVVGFYHSHPDHPARPSALDLENAWPGLYQIVLEVSNGRAREATAWRLSADRASFAPEPIAEGKTGC